MPISVFISSTSQDLLNHRAIVSKALLNAGFHPVDMANFMARPEGATSACLKEVASSDLFLGIYAWRYGFIPEDAEISITEQEFVEAEKLGKPCFCFLVDEQYDWPEVHREKGIGARLLRDFKARINAKLVRTTFTTPDDLATKVLASIQRWEREQASKRIENEQTLPGDRAVFNMQGVQIKAGTFSQGSVQNITGPFTVDMSETTIEVERGGTYVSGDQFSGDFRDAIVNIKSQLDHVTQTVEVLPNFDQAGKEDLIRLVGKLKQQLEKVPPESAQDAEKVSKRVKALVEEVNVDEPDKEMIKITGESLKRAAQNLAAVMPPVLAIATQIVSHVLKFVG